MLYLFVAICVFACLEFKELCVFTSANLDCAKDIPAYLSSGCIVHSGGDKKILDGALVCIVRWHVVVPL